MSWSRLRSSPPSSAYPGRAKRRRLRQGQLERPDRQTERVGGAAICERIGGVHWSPPKRYDVSVASTTPTLATSSIADISPGGVRIARKRTLTGRPALRYPAVTDGISDRPSCFVFER